MAQLTGLTVIHEGQQTQAELVSKHPGETLIRQGLAAMEDGHQCKALELLMDGIEAFAEGTNQSLPYD